MTHATPPGGWKRRAGDEHTRLTRFLLNLDPLLAAVFYVGFVTVAVFVVIVYARSINLELNRHARESDAQIVAAQIASCRRVNKVRRALNVRNHAVDRFLVSLHSTQSIPPSAEKAYNALVSLPDLQIVDCARIVRAAVLKTGG